MIDLRQNPHIDALHGAYLNMTKDRRPGIRFEEASRQLCALISKIERGNFADSDETSDESRELHISRLHRDVGLNTLRAHAAGEEQTLGPAERHIELAGSYGEELVEATAHDKDTTDGSRGLARRELGATVTTRGRLETYRYALGGHLPALNKSVGSYSDARSYFPGTHSTWYEGNNALRAAMSARLADPDQAAPGYERLHTARFWMQEAICAQLAAENDDPEGKKVAKNIAATAAFIWSAGLTRKAILARP